jgi:hypothetical protein
MMDELWIMNSERRARLFLALSVEGQGTRCNERENTDREGERERERERERRHCETINRRANLRCCHFARRRGGEHLNLRAIGEMNPIIERRVNSEDKNADGSESNISNVPEASDVRKRKSKRIHEHSAAHAAEMLKSFVDIDNEKVKRKR